MTDLLASRPRGPAMSEHRSAAGREERIAAMWVRRVVAAQAGLAAIAIFVTPAAARPSTRLVSCGADDCLLVSGRRAARDVPVRLNGRPVAVEGGKRWRVRVPLDTVRQWSTVRARTIRVTVPHPVTREDVSEEADLPIGLLGERIDLAALVVRVH